MPLEIVGRNYDPEYFSHLKSLSRGKRVRFLNDVDDTELVRAYQRARLLVLPSTYQDFRGQRTRVPELLGQTALEGMACETPVLLSEVASLPELIVEGAQGKLFADANVSALREKIEWFLNNPQTARAMGRKARAHVVENFRWESVVDRCLDFYGGKP